MRASCAAADEEDPAICEAEMISASPWLLVCEDNPVLVWDEDVVEGPAVMVRERVQGTKAQERDVSKKCVALIRFIGSIDFSCPSSSTRYHSPPCLDLTEGTLEAVVDCSDHRDPCPGPPSA